MKKGGVSDMGQEVRVVGGEEERGRGHARGLLRDRKF